MTEYLQWLADMRRKTTEKEQALRDMTPDQMRYLEGIVRSANALLDELKKEERKPFST